MVKLIKGVNDLATLRPDLALQWHPIKNGTLTPQSVTCGLNVKAWWICSLGHEWEARIADRSKGCGCPICAGQKVLIGYNDLATTNPELAKQWHPTKNGDLKPTNVTQYSGQKVWWACVKGHEWCATINDRSRGNGCPICASESQTSFPEQAIYYYLKQIDNTVENRKKINNKWEVDVWVPSKNIAIEYDGCRYHNGKKSKQKEQKKNEYLKNCGIRLIRVKESADKNIEVCIEKDIINFSIKNKYVDLPEVINKLIKIVFDDIRLIIDINMDKTTILESYKQDCLNNSLATINPELASQWHPTKNGTLTPDMFTQWSNEKAWWICPLGHEWQDTISHRSGKRGCPVCANKQVLKGYNDLATTNPELAKQWHPTKNGDLKPTDVTQYSGKKVWWICSLGHEWQATIANMSRSNGCPICSGHQVLAGYNDLATVNPELALQWHPTKNGDLTPQMVRAHSGKKAWWVCSLGHEWEAQINSRSNGSGCPICSGNKVLRGYNDLATTNPKLASEWHPTKNGGKTPEMFSAGSNEKVWWKCPCGHEWCDTISHRSCGRGCVMCFKNKCFK
jgi:very-short-patch-repair endonuclease